MLPSLMTVLLSSAIALTPITRDGITVRFVEVGEFRESLVQGMELEVINGSDTMVTCDVTLTLSRATPPGGTFHPVNRTERKQIGIPSHALQGFRVGMSLTYGRCRVNYEVKIDSRVVVADSVDFHASGPCRVVNVRPYFLSRDAVRIRVEVPQISSSDGAPITSSPTRFRFKLLNGDATKTLYETGEFRLLPQEMPFVNIERPPTRAETFVSFAGQPPGRYVVEVEVFRSDRGKQLAKARAFCDVRK